jgi:GrpB-like predicted nucleotidyltransferase (UPF0157 family)
MIKGKAKQNGGGSTGGSAAADEKEQPNYRQNPEINAKIDAYIKNNPDHWERIQSMPKERMARTIVLNAVRNQERDQRINEAVKKKLDANPEQKKAYETLVKDLPADQRQQMIVTLARRNQRTIAPKAAEQQQSAKLVV